MSTNSHNHHGLPATPMDAANFSDSALASSATSTSPTESGNNMGGSAYSPASGDNFTTTNSGKNANLQMLSHLYQRASRWVGENPAIAMAAVAGIAAAIFGFVAASRSAGRSSGNANQDAAGQTYGDMGNHGGVTSDASAYPESLDAVSSVTSNDRYTGL